MAVKTCEEVINGASYAGGEGSEGKRVTRDSDFAVAGLPGGGDGDFLDAVIAAAGKVGNTADALYNYDCSTHLLEWMYRVCPSLKTVGNGVDSIVNRLNGITSGISVGEMVQNNSVTQSMCSAVVTVFGMVDAWLEMLSRSAFALFDKIDMARESMQAALQSLNDSVLRCILDVYDMIEKYLTGMLKLSLNFEWGAFEEFLENCPCVCRFVAFVTGCDKDSDGNNISDQPDLVLHCIRDKFWFIDGLNLATGLTAILDDYIKNYIVLMFDAISLAIDSMFMLFIKPFRMLIKSYATFLRKKWDVTFMVEPLRRTHLDCLLIYTKEVKDGKTVYTMSILDMMESMKMWVNCLEYPCRALAERIKNRVKKFNEDMRLTGDFWRRAYEVDIYQCCMRADAAMASDMSPKEMQSLWDDLLDRLRTCNSRAKNRVAFAKVTYGLDGTGAVTWHTKEMRTGASGDAAIEMRHDPVLMAAQFSDSPDRENDINVGQLPLTQREDELIRAIGLSVSAGCDEDTYFVEKWYQYLRFAGQYAISENTVDELRNARDNVGKMGGNYGGGNTTNFPTTKARIPSRTVPEDRQSNYWVDSDFDGERVAKIMDIKWDGPSEGESLSGYYARMYASVG